MNNTMLRNSLREECRTQLFDSFSGKGTSLTFRKKDIIEFSGKPTEYVYLVKAGYVQQYFLDPSGNIKTLLILSKGDIFGEITLFQQDKDLVITQAYEDTTVEKIPVTTFTKILESHPDIYSSITILMSNKVRILMAQIQDSSFCDITQRLKNLLIRLGNQFGRPTDNGIVIEPKFTHEDLARMISSTRSTVSKKMKVFKDDGFIDIVNRQIILK